MDTSLRYGLLDAGLRLNLIHRDTIVPEQTEKDIRVKKIEYLAPWVTENSLFNRIVGDISGKKLSTSVDALKELENCTIGQIKMIHNQTTLQKWNNQGYHIETNDRMKHAEGGLMWGGLFTPYMPTSLVDLESREKFEANLNSHRNKYAKFHVLPLGKDFTIPSLVRQSAAMIALDMPDFMESLENDENESGDIMFLVQDVTPNLAKFLHTQYGFRIAYIWKDATPLDRFPGWSELSMFKNVSIKIFASRSDFDGIYERAITYKEKVVSSLNIYNRAKYTLYEQSLRKLALAVNTTNESIVKSPMITKWWEVYKPEFVNF